LGDCRKGIRLAVKLSLAFAQGHEILVLGLTLGVKSSHNVLHLTVHYITWRLASTDNGYPAELWNWVHCTALE